MPGADILPRRAAVGAYEHAARGRERPTAIAPAGIRGHQCPIVKHAKIESVALGTRRVGELGPGRGCAVLRIVGHVNSAHVGIAISNRSVQAVWIVWIGFDPSYDVAEVVQGLPRRAAIS